MCKEKITLIAGVSAVRVIFYVIVGVAVKIVSVLCRILFYLGCEDLLFLAFV